MRFTASSFANEANRFVNVPLFFRKASLSSVSSGFTLVQIIVDLAILSVLITFLVILIDPMSQLDKANDSKRKRDLEQINNALDTYYNDHQCYPTSLQFGSEWSVSGTVYMKTVPQDPNCKTNPTSCYVYQVDDTNSCPQWNVLYSKLTNISSEDSGSSGSVSSCPLYSLSSCTPLNFDNSYSCILSGTINCGYISSNPLYSPTGGSDGGVSPTIPQAPEACPVSERRYSCTGGSPLRCNVVSVGTGDYCTSQCGGDC